ncbi:30S ribosomal protein S3 [Candidatus Woesebacteria bacterium CG22_combo_CG10-13_8_21_14_all_39_10]|uniref:Small ribosomal subunit protein uS3 n=4 Tax=Candidatus Woeseibacteriota TaxID=1752722 RepID=A0A2M7XA49_9BACT|nr:MAG: 30S ribosomal protein S3 [Candidatus Woesebacteria bacterium CG22_combo_CG10-13_8_21_14_all_39_10]PIU71915.1 MAG: 30S ribosomal protein S3 [Candidatus Woesebacteria bacterium CG06_land_8_20_14_3_00_39_27]PIZ48697.1 MAG: 30S ribosomal protein S3 [Candidatus Woesebacteria bacterium CG_4_10_14_0_2_um_filter_39_14]PJA43028.1 MAG: 30S ribosomal protein S3 [Candidatus Woesebacteria bacterium CG_4_9_14_3_um_filter_39_10]
MSQKINPVGIRTGTFLPWKSRWFSSNANFSKYLIEDVVIRRALLGRLKLSGITEVEIERLPKSMVIAVTVSRPGIVIGRGGSGIEEIKKFIVDIISKVRGKKLSDIKIDFKVNEIKNPEISAKLVAERVAADLEKRMPQRRVVTRAMERVMASGAKGVKIVLGGRIQGAEISRVEKYHMGSVPSQTLRALIDYAQVPALLKRGYVGVKVWVHKKEEE